MSHGTSLSVQWLTLCASAAGGEGLIPHGGNQDPTCHRKILKFVPFQMRSKMQESLEKVYMIRIICEENLL